jgi:hypothetical protein
MVVIEKVDGKFSFTHRVLENGFYRDYKVGDFDTPEQVGEEVRAFYED